MSTVSKDDNLVLTSEESSSYPDDSGLELGLGLSLGGGDGGGGGGNSRLALNSEPGQWSQYARILTAKDFPSLGSSLSSSSSSSSYLTKANFSGADPVSPPANNGVSQVVGWPPVRAYRMNSLANQAKYPTSEEFQSPTAKSKSKNGVIDLNVSEKEGCIDKEKGQMKSSLYVKVNMDGNLIGRKVDLSAHSCYETLAQTMEDMFCRPATSIGTRRLEGKEHDVRMEATGSLKLLDGSSEFVLTYEDKDGDWMLVGDVPWGMFFNSVKRLRIMRTSEANGLGPRFQQGDGRQIGHV